MLNQQEYSYLILLLWDHRSVTKLLAFLQACEVMIFAGKPARRCFRIPFNMTLKIYRNGVLVLRDSSVGYITTRQVCLLLKSKQWKQETDVG